MSDIITNAELRIEAERLIDENGELRSEKAALERRIDELCSGNQRLLEEVMSLKAALEGMHIINDRYRADHAKLTNLAKQMYPYAKAHLQLGVTLGCNDTLSYDWALQMVELGIEVPE